MGLNLKSVNIFLIRCSFYIFCIILSPMLIINSFFHKRKIKREPFARSLVVRFCDRYPIGYQVYNFIMNFPLSFKVYSILPPLDKKRILQVGSGTGALNKYYKKYEKNASVEFVNLDTNLNSINYAIKTGAYKNYINADICRVPLDNDNFDVIVFARCFHHIKNAKAAFRECARLLKSGGTIIISDVVSLSADFPDKSFMMNSNFDGLIWRYKKVAFESHIQKSLPEALRVKSFDYIRQMSITNYNTAFPHTDGLVIIEKSVS
jgi:SAM-dependent methyltransferase